MPFHEAFAFDARDTAALCSGKIETAQLRGVLGRFGLGDDLADEVDLGSQPRPIYLSSSFMASPKACPIRK
jgi:hypothetical protein